MIRRLNVLAALIPDTSPVFALQDILEGDWLEIAWVPKIIFYKATHFYLLDYGSFG